MDKQYKLVYLKQTLMLLYADIDALEMVGFNTWWEHIQVWWCLIRIRRLERE